MDNILEYLRKLELFADLSDESLSAVARQMRPCRLAAGEVLFEKGDPGDSLYIVTEGQVKVYVRPSHTEEVTLQQFGPGESFGEMALIDKEPRSASVSAINNARLLELNHDAFLDLLRENPAFGMDIMRDLSAKLRFAATYVQKAIDWSQHIARGDYHVAMGEIHSHRVQGDPLTDDERANAFLSAFFKMVEGVQAREQELRQQVQLLQIEIDEARKQTMVSEITETDYFRELQKKAREMRRKPPSEQ